MRREPESKSRLANILEQLAAMVIFQVVLGIVASAKNLPVELVLGWGLFAGTLLLWVYNNQRKPRRLPTTSRTYKNQVSSAPDIVQDITNGNRLVRILCLSSTSIYPIVSAAVKESLKKGLGIKIMMIDPESPHGRHCIENIAKRENLKLSGDDYMKIIQEQIQKWLKLEEELRMRGELKGHLSVGLYDHTPTYRGFIIDESIAFLGHYYGATHGFDNPLFFVKKTGDEFEKGLLSQFLEVYDSMWEEARKINS